MRRALGVAAGLAAIAALAGPGSAQAFAHPTEPELSEQFDRGEYMPAADAAETVGAADDLAFAARSLLALYVTSDGEPDAALVERAQKDAEAALKLDPENEEGKLQLAIALSMKIRTMDLVQALVAGYGDRGRDLAEEVLAADPENQYAHGFLAVWNIEVRRRSGAVGASLMRASMEQARAHYAEAVRLSPDSIGVHWQYARALVALDVEAYGAEAAVALERALSTKPDAHVEEVMQARAQKLFEALHAGDPKAAQALARGMM